MLWELRPEEYLAVAGALAKAAPQSFYLFIFVVWMGHRSVYGLPRLLNGRQSRNGKNLTRNVLLIGLRPN
jgi:hypothetical protein